ncbi:MAG: AAA family ATPase [Clostridia bacterium]|nr:AAA family ATPase [Clostridia bacterium]
MKTLEEIRDLFVSARKLANEASPSNVEIVAEKIQAISDHCKELYAVETSYLEKAKCINMYESLDNIVSILLARGFVDERVAAFFGFIDAAKGAPSFSDISSGNGTVKKPDLPPPPAAGKGSLPESEWFVGGEKGNTPAGGDLTPPPPPAKEDKANEPDGEDVPTPPTPKTEKPAVDGNGKIPVASDDKLEPQSFDEFIGQEHIIRRLREEIEAAKILGKSYIDNIMLFGNRGLGKSTLMKLIAKELGVEFRFIDCTSLMNNTESQKSFHQFFMNIAAMDEPVVIACDEIHALTPRLQSCLLTLLNDRVYSYLANGVTKNIPIKNFTFIGATTDYDAVLTTLKDRCSNLTFMMKDYTRDELRRILINKLAAVGLTASEDALWRCINRCRSSIRDVRSIVLGLRTKAVVYKTSEVNVDMAELYFKERGLDPIGLNEKDLEILRAIANEPRGSISEETLSARVYLDPKILTKEYEPYLMKIGFISINSRGRTLTPIAEEYLRYGYYEFADGTHVGEKPAPDGSMTLTPIAKNSTPETPAPVETPVPPASEQEPTPPAKEEEPLPPAPVEIAPPPVPVDEGETPAIPELPTPPEAPAEIPMPVDPPVPPAPPAPAEEIPPVPVPVDNGEGEGE